MSRITDLIKAYRRGDIQFPELSEALGTMNYKDPKRWETKPVVGSANYAVELYTWMDEQNFDEEGTWDEVDIARDEGLLTSAEYLAINRAVNEHQKRKELDLPVKPFFDSGNFGKY